MDFRKQRGYRLLRNKKGEIVSKNETVQEIKERFEEKFITVPECGCWLWIATTPGFGYGLFKLPHKNPRQAHRVSWEIYNGHIPDGMYVLHHCDTPSCVNPRHLFLGTHQDNVTDCVNKKRNYTVPKGNQIWKFRKKEIEKQSFHSF